MRLARAPASTQAEHLAFAVFKKLGQGVPACVQVHTGALFPLGVIRTNCAFRQRYSIVGSCYAINFSCFNKRTIA